MSGTGDSASSNEAPPAQTLLDPALNSGPDLAERVAAKEEAVRTVLAGLQKIADDIADAKHGTNLDLDAWKSLVDALQRDASAFQYLIGTGGDTGVGKSSLLNVLVSEAADIAPSSQNGACTAAVCCFSYPKPGQTDKAFAATIRLKSRETVDQELAAFFQEFNEFEDRVELDGGDDSVTYGEHEKFHEQLDLIRGWSGLDRQLLVDLGRNNLASEITQRCKHGHELFDAKDPQRGVIVAVAKEDAREFLLAVKPYVGSTAKAKLLRWPLVEMVDVFVKADILRSGIVLADLPGEMDALEARSQVARRYYNKLDRLMVVAPGDRAFDNRTAIELIREDQVMDLEADGMIRDSGLCVVVTKVDQMDWRSFVETEWPADEIPPEVLAMMEELEGKKNELSRIEQGDDTEPSSLVDGRRAVADEMRRLDALCLGKCIEARSNDTRRTFQEYVDHIRNSMRAKAAAKVSTELDVFPVSSKAHRALARGQPEPAFHDARSTGIDDLKAWMLRGSLPRREEHVDGILHRCHVLFDAIGGWAADEGHAAARLPEAERPNITSVLDQQRWILKEELAKMTRNFGYCIDRLQKTSSPSHEGRNAGSAQRFVAHVDAYQRSTSGDVLHWSTYAACIRRRGGAFRTYAKPRKTHCWQARTYGLFCGPHAFAWGQVFGQRLADKTRSLDGNLQMMIARHIDDVSRLETLPAEFRESFRSCAYKVENLFGEHRTRVKEALARYWSTARLIKLGSRERIADLMRDAYVEAQGIAGKDKKKRQVATMRSHAEQLKGSLFADVGQAVDAELKKARGDVKKTLRGLADKVVTQVAKAEGLVVSEVCSMGKRPKKTSDAESGLRRAVRKSVGEWRRYWDALKLKLPRAAMGPADDDFLSEKEGARVKREDVDDGGLQSVPAKKRAGGGSQTARKRPAKAGGGPRKQAREKGEGGNTAQRRGQSNE